MHCTSDSFVVWVSAVLGAVHLAFPAYVAGNPGLHPASGSKEEEEEEEEIGPFRTKQSKKQAWWLGSKDR